ncbi:hypothetical protein vseg_014114 [Gypsophila vaccaria]
MEFQTFLLAFALITRTWISAYGEESSAETYWKMNLGKDVIMPKVIKDALSGRQDSKSYKNLKNNEVQAYAQELSNARTNRPTKDYRNGVAQDYAQQLTGIKNNRAYNIYSGQHPVASQQLSTGTKTNHVGQAFYGDNAAQAYAQQLSRAKTTLGVKIVYDNNATQAYAQQLSRAKTTLGVKIVYNSSAAQAYAQQLSGTKTNLAATKVYTESSKPSTDDSVIFFLVKDLTHPGTRMKLHFLMGAQEAKFMPRQLANSVPFSSNKLPQILKFFNVHPTSANAKMIEETITLCESKPIKGEAKSCKTTLESMVNYVKSRLGSQIKALSTEIDKETKQEYRIESARKIESEKNTVCHKMVYPYAVFFCHTLSKTDAYQVSLIDSNGKNVRAVAVCHKDTSPWNPGHIAFQVLKVKPGGVPVCHFLDADAMIWVTTN